MVERVNISTAGSGGLSRGLSSAQWRGRNVVQCCRMRGHFTHRISVRDSQWNKRTLTKKIAIQAEGYEIPFKEWAAPREDAGYREGLSSVHWIGWLLSLGSSIPLSSVAQRCNISTVEGASASYRWKLSSVQLRVFTIRQKTCIRSVEKRLSLLLDLEWWSGEGYSVIDLEHVFPPFQHGRLA